MLVQEGNINSFLFCSCFFWFSCTCLFTQLCYSSTLVSKSRVVVFLVFWQMLHSLLVLLSRQRLVSFLTKRFVSCCLHCRGPAGDLYVSLDVRDIPDIERDGINLRSSISISYINAILGSIEKVHFLPCAQSIIFWIFRANVVIGQGLHGSA